MKYWSQIILMFVVCLVTVACRSFAADDHPDQKLSQQVLKEEFNQITSRLENEVPDMYYLCPRATYDSTKQAVLRSLSDSMSIISFYRHIMPLFTVLRDPHFQCFVDKKMLDKLDEENPGLYFPFTVMIHDGRIFIDENLSTEKNISRGTEILGINGVTAAEILRRIKCGVVYTANQENFFEQWHESIFYRDLLLMLAFRSNFKVQLPNRTIQVKGVSRKDLAKIEPITPDFEYKLLDAPNQIVGYLKIGTLINDKRDSLQSVLERFFKEVNERHIQDIIIDIRGNLGGSTKLVRLVFDHITDQECIFGLDEIYLKNGVRTSLNDTAQPISRHLKRDYFGRTVLLTDVKTFSSAHMMANAFKFYNLGKIVGQVSMEPLFISGEVEKRVLNRSRCYFYFPTTNFSLPGFEATKISYLIPDVEVMPDIRDRLNQRDMALEKARMLLLGKGTADK